MIPVQERVEFGSSAWLATARDVLAREIAAAPGVRFSVCELYRNAPAHLPRTGDVVSWHIRVGDGQVSVEQGELEGADRSTTGDYHAALPLAMTVYFDAAAEHRAKRENTHRSGPNAIESKGELTDPTVLAVLTRFHNEMARRTLDNTDLDSRIAGQGLQRHVKELEDEGYTILENAFTHDFADELRAAILGLVSKEDETLLGVGNPARLLARGRLFEEAALHPWVLTLVERQTGKLFHMGQSLGTVRATGGGLALHDDFILMREPFAPYSMATTCIWALEDFTAEAGPTLVLPGSHHKRHHPPNNYLADPADYPMKQILMPKGSLALWDSATWHGAKTRTAEGQRVALHNYFCRVFVQPFDDYLSISQEVLDRNPPIMTTMCGLDVPYRRNTDAGPNYELLGHALAHYDS
jgi:ectoine hydroxylase-related dioxygenase (phytanoyl-CoA dioxygenase family)